MIKSLSFLLKYFLFWMLFFFLNRLLFEIWYSFFSSFTLTEILKTFWNGAHMDASMTGYICVLPFLYYLLCWMIPSFKFRSSIVKYYSFILIIITSLISLTDINIYREWGTKFNYRAIEFLFTSANDAVASTLSSPIFLSAILAIGLITIGIFLYKYFQFEKSIPKGKPLLLRIFIALIIVGLNFLAIRGGWGIAPMNPSKVYFSHKHELNLASINTNWFLMSDILANKKNNKNLYKYYPEDRAFAIKDSLFKSGVIKDSTFQILNTKRPNIVFIIMESFTADLVEELGGEKGVTPKFAQLIKEGLLFRNIYSASDRTDKGIVAVLSGFPSQAIKSIIKENEKQEKLPSVPTELSKLNYQTSFIYGGDLDFSNFRSYILSHQTKKIIDAADFKTEEKYTKWGYADNLTFDESLKWLKKEKIPFFQTILTLTNHEPFYLATPYKFGQKNNADKFRSTSYFTDSALFHFFEEAKKQPWYQNTLFVIVADHGHREPKEINEIENPARYHIPLLFLGGALKAEYKGQMIDKVGAQIDIPALVLSQMGISDTAFHYSKNLLNPTVKGFSFFSWDNGFGYIDSAKAISFDPIGNYVLYQKPKDMNPKEKANALQNAKALMQSVYTDFVKY